MGMLLSQYMKPRNLKVIVLGLDAAGKTTLLYRVKEGRTPCTIPTIGFNVEEIYIKGVKFIMWDIGGQDKVRDMWKYYFNGVSTLVFVVDSSDRDRMEEARLALENILMDPKMEACAVLIFANKQDIEEAMKPREVAQKLGLTESSRKNWKIQPSCAITGDGLYEGLEWIVREEKTMRKLRKQKKKQSKEMLAKRRRPSTR